jgi:hypothetical protein|tara:strand:+ start:5066 stop:5452 length:387 start_codon:yes stop_codon:yes gene_type:complete
MSAMSDYLELKFLDHFTGRASTTAPSAVYLGLAVGSIADNAGGTELSGSNYAREAITFAVASGGAIANNNAVEFNSATGSWGTVAYWGIWDASTSGNLLFHGAFTASKAIATGDILKVASGSLTISAD